MKRTLVFVFAALMAIASLAQNLNFGGLEIGTSTANDFKDMMAAKNFTYNPEAPGLTFTGVMDGCFTVASADINKSNGVVKALALILISEEWESHELVMLEFATALVQTYGENYELLEPKGEDFDQQYKMVLRNETDAIVFENAVLDDGSFQTSVLFTTEYTGKE